MTTDTDKLRELLQGGKIEFVDCPVGTKAFAVMGGHWTKVENGRWQWGTGSTFPTPGGDWTGEFEFPQLPISASAILALLDDLDRLRGEVNRYNDQLNTMYVIRDNLEKERTAARLEGWRLAQDQAAEECQKLELDLWNLYKGRKPYTGTEDGRADPHVQGESDGAGQCFYVISALQPPAEWGE